jgi:hypothetical protein
MQFSKNFQSKTTENYKENEMIHTIDDIEANAVKEQEVTVCLICGETCDVCAEHGTPSEQKALIEKEIEAQAAQARLHKMILQSHETHRQVMNQLMAYVLHIQTF